MITTILFSDPSGSRTLPPGRRASFGPAIRRSRWCALLLALLLPLSACGDIFEVDNPGAVEDELLDRQATHEALVNGVALELSEALNWVSYTTGSISREIFPAGSTGSFGITPLQQQGILDFSEVATPWENSQRARQMAEEGFERFERVLSNEGGDVQSYAPAAKISLWAGYAYRLLGENWCEAVIDGSEIMPYTVFLEGAEEWFTRAMAIAERAGETDIATAARAGRASVRLDLGNFAGAVEDASQVPTDFVWAMQYDDIQQDQYNRVFWATANEPYRAHTVWRTPWEDYYRTTGDPRTPWASNDSIPVGDAAVGPFGTVPWYFELKYDEKGDDINLSAGWEMRLIEAEALLREGSWEQAVAIMNERRTSLGIAPWEPSSLEEAWTAFKRERGAELWLEGRRMWDLRRWQMNDTPGALSPLETPGEASYLSENRTLCYPIPQEEREANPNIPVTP